MPSTIEKETLEVLLRDETKIIKALETYYTRFCTGDSITFQGAALISGANPAFMVDYMFYRGEYRFGMPDDREDALEYLNNLRRLKKDIGLDNLN